MYLVTKRIDFCYGHRLLNYAGKCRHLHGHNARVEVDIESNQLDQRGMVYDFSDIKEVIKKWIDDTLDHNMLLNKADPVVAVLKYTMQLFSVLPNAPPALAELPVNVQLVRVQKAAAPPKPAELPLSAGPPGARSS